MPISDETSIKLPTLIKLPEGGRLQSMLVQLTALLAETIDNFYK